MALKQVIGQERALKILRRCIAKNRIAHAYLFAGEDGIGKKLTAVNFAKTLNCRNNADDSLFTAGEKEKSAVEADSCDNCSSCVKIDKRSHPDVFFIAPENGQIKVNAIRRLEESLSYKAFEGNWKIAVIDGAETLNQSAANAFLKTLEEPPGRSVLVLISSMPELVPLTVRSRCQRINFSPLPLKKMGELLEHGLSTERTP
ncbi:MAG TPA: DNA polymerase III subunit delta', partial [Nitrospirae bacterium]|nr:DNA polymerase III subunit delta' [Nitrospirota bacterium]